MAPRFLLCLLLIAGCHRKAPSPPSAAGEDLSDIKAKIGEWAETCDDARTKQDCDDGDAMLFNGVLCLSGDGFACAAVEQMEYEGRFWRSPKRVGKDTKNSFSRDMGLGVLAYMVATHDRARMNLYTRYLSTKRRLCPDATDNRCDITPTFAALYNLVAHHIGAKELSYDKSKGDPVLDLIWQAEEPTLPRGFERHLLGVQVYIRKAMGDWSPALQGISENLYRKDPENAFFAFLAGLEPAGLIERHAPHERPESRAQWSFERSDESEAWKESCGWEWVFLINNLEKMGPSMPSTSKP